MEMTAEEICRDYRLAKNKNRQLRILAGIKGLRIDMKKAPAAGQSNTAHTN